MVTFAEVMATRPVSWSDAAGIYRVLAEEVADRADELSAVVATLRSGWTGAAAESAFARLGGLLDQLRQAYPGLVAIDQILTEFADTVTVLRSDLKSAAAPRPGSIVRVQPDGSVLLVPVEAAPDGGDQVDLANTRTAVDDVMARARAADTETTKRLADVRFAVDAGMTPPAVPAPGTAPATVAAWWSVLTPAQQLFLITTDTRVVANLDGVPADARDRAGRILIRQQYQALADEDAALRAAGPATGSRAEALTTVDAELAGLTTLEQRLDDPSQTRAYLLGIDADDDRAIVSVSNPDRAADVLTFVPGVGTGLRKIDETLTSLDRIDKAGRALPGAGPLGAAAPGDLATIGWIDYHAPASVPLAVTTAEADDAAPRLSSFQDSLRQTHVGPQSHNTVLGYSYGSVVTGTAAREQGLDCDDVVLVASPGTTVGGAADLGVPSGHVWATVARDDPIRLAVRPVLGPNGVPTETGWFGPSPTDPSYGAHVFTSDPGSILHPAETHLAYFDIGSPSLDNIADIALGRDSDVS